MKKRLAVFYFVLAVMMLFGMKAQAAGETVTGPDTVVTGEDGAVSSCADIQREFVCTTDGVHWSAGSFAGVETPGLSRDW